MANTFSQIHLHIVFAVKYRDGMLMDAWRDELFAYIAGVIKMHGQTPVKVGGFRDHVHLLVGCNTSVNISGLVKDVKLATNKWIQPRHRCRFAWQDGYAVFSVSATHIDAVKCYIDRQDEHHSNINMLDEFRWLLTVNKVGYDERFLPKAAE